MGKGTEHETRAEFFAVTSHSRIGCVDVNTGLCANCGRRNAAPRPAGGGLVGGY